MHSRLTKKQRELREDLDNIARTIGVDYWNILDREPEARTPVLEVTKREMIRGEIVSQYTLIDDLLASKLCEYFFPGQKLIQLWKTKRFQRFNYYILERLYLVQKLVFVKDVYRVPKNIVSTIEEINALRNAMAHTFLPENLRVYQMKGRPAPRKPITVWYKGQDVFTASGMQKFKDDCVNVCEFLVLTIKRRKKQGLPQPVPGPVALG
jgi:hypothetical protein